MASRPLRLPGLRGHAFIFTKYDLPPQNFVPIAYLGSTLLLTAAVWLSYGWTWAVGSFVAASLFYGRIHAAALRRARRERYQG